MKLLYLKILISGILLFDIEPCLSLTLAKSEIISQPVSIISPSLISPQPNENLSFAEGNIRVIKGKIYFDKALENDLELQIYEAKKELMRLKEMLALNFTEDLGFVYFHQGQNRWRLRFTFGGLLLKTSTQLSLSTEQIFSLKGVFDHTESIDIKGIKYNTTGSMRQLGPILHEE